MSESSARSFNDYVSRQVTPRNGIFLLFNILALIVYYEPMRDLMALSLSYHALYSHIILIPLISGYFVLLERRVIFSDKEYAFTAGITIILIGGLLYLLGMTHRFPLSQNDHISLMAFSAVIFWIGGFVFFYGVRAFRNASFPLLFLAFMIPIPALIMDKIVFLLQSASAEVSYVYLNLAGVPIFREGFVFHLPGISIEVAKECSGIRSALALLITSILAGHLFLRRGWSKVILVLAVFPIAVLKNGLRIFTLSWLGVYVDQGYITHSLLHSNGGIPFFVLALGFLALVLWLLSRWEKRGEVGRAARGNVT